MTKYDLIDRICFEFGYTKAEAFDLVETVLESMKDTLQGGENIKLQGFGHFKVKEKAPRKGRNPKTGGEITIAGRKIVTFSPSPVLRSAINGEGL